ncbi:DUF3606 domain-containing protein [Rhodoligotrophos ferricapiens]|uniref:DUF3606 domain-containing protein n=1 Tax=Rhodoligotrophos ferricapiens TaxID=3069264 RepID=UPI00315D8AD5
MADDPSKRGAQDRSRLSGDQEHEVRYFAEQHGLSMEEARAVMDKVGNDRSKLDSAIEEITARQGP